MLLQSCSSRSRSPSNEVMSSTAPLKLRDDHNNNNHKNITMQMVAMDHQPFAHHLIHRGNHQLLLSNHHNIRMDSPQENESSHALQPTNDHRRALEANDVKGHRNLFNHLNGLDGNNSIDEQMSCSPLSSGGEDLLHQSSNHGSGQEHSSPVVGRKRRKHSGPPVRPTCTDCGKDFSNQSALSKHKLTHSDVRRFACEICQKAFKRQDHLNGHMLTHREKKPYECDVEGCEKTYCDARSLRRHKENHHSSINVSSGTNAAPVTANNVATSALRSLLSGHSGVLFPHHNLFSHGQLGGSAPNNPSLNMSLNQGFHQGQGYNYPTTGNNLEMPSPHSPAPRMRQQQQQTALHPHHPPPPIAIDQTPVVSTYNSGSVPTTPTTHPQTPISAEPIPSPHHLSVNGNHYGQQMNGQHQQPHPCTTAQPANTFSFSPHQVQQYHQQQQEQNGARSLPTTPTDHQESPLTPVGGFSNGHHYQHVYQHHGDMHHEPRSLPATPVDHLTMSYSVHHQATSYNDPNPSPYSVASQSSPYDLHQPASHLQNQQSNSSNYQAHHEPRQQLHSNGTYEEETFQSSTNQNVTDIDEYDISQIDVQNLMEHIQSSSGQTLQHQQLEAHQNFYPQTEPITPTTPATPSSFHSFPIPNKFQAHNFRSNVIQNQDTHLRQGNTFSSGKSMPQALSTQQQNVDHHHDQQMLQVEPVSHQQDLTNTMHLSDAATFQVPTLISRNPPVNCSSVGLKQNGLYPGPVHNVSDGQSFGHANYSAGFRHELRSSTPPNLVVNLSPMTSRPASTVTMSSNVTISDESGFREPAAKYNSNDPTVIIEEDDDVFSPSDVEPESTLNERAIAKLIHRNCTSGTEYFPNQKGICNPRHEVGNNGKNQTNLKRSHETVGVIVHGTDQNIRQQNNLPNDSNNQLLLQALQKTQLLAKGSNENKKPFENNKVELRSPKRMRHKPEPIYIPPQVNAFGVSNHFLSRTSRSPRIWDGKGSQMPSSVNHSAF